jgi:hypothetical protein
MNRDDKRRVLYCHCAYARVVPADVKQEVLTKLAESDVMFDAVPDLCEMSARHDPKLKDIAESGAAQIVACYPRAVKWLFAAADARLPEAGVEVLNMREQPAASIVQSILGAQS